MNSVTKERSNSNSNYHNIKYTILVTIWIIVNYVPVVKQELIKFWKSSAPGTRNFWKNSSALQDGVLFHALAYVSGKLTEFSVASLGGWGADRPEW